MRPLLVSFVCCVIPACHTARANERPPGPAQIDSGQPSLSPAPSVAPAAQPTAHAEPPRAPAPPERPACPEDMARVELDSRAFCIDRWEASLMRRVEDGSLSPWPGNQRIDGLEDEMIAVSIAGRKPQGYVSGVQAERACHAAGKRLCAIAEWRAACRGPGNHKYPYGDERREGVCNDRFKVLDAHPVVRLFERYAPAGTDRARMWHPAWMNDPRLHELSRSVEATGAREECHNEYGVYDLVGNLHEWVDDADGTFVGGFFMDTFQNGEGCDYRTTAHEVEYHDYSTGFRCCRDADAT